MELNEKHLRSTANPLSLLSRYPKGEEGKQQWSDLFLPDSKETLSISARVFLCLHRDIPYLLTILPISCSLSWRP